MRAVPHLRAQPLHPGHLRYVAPPFSAFWRPQTSPFPHISFLTATTGATLASFLIALLHFALELFAYGTIGFKTAVQPMVVATVSSLWMIAGWNYYTAFAPHAEPT